jgi:hypothetical protein
MQKKFLQTLLISAFLWQGALLCCNEVLATDTGQPAGQKTYRHQQVQAGINHAQEEGA